MFSKVLVANRGEIAVRAFRAATELSAKTVAVFPYEDRKSEHVLKADEAYRIGEEGHPVRAYLDPEGIVRTAVEAGADAVYPGYGFLSENPDLAEACAAAGVTFVGPPAVGAAPDRQQGTGHRRGQEGRPADPQGFRAEHRHRRPRRRRRGDRLPDLRQGRRRRRRTRDAPGRAPRGPARVARGLHARGRVGVRRPDRLPRGGRGQPAPHRGADPRGRGGQRDPPVRAGLLGAATPPEGRRDRPRAQPRPRAARADVRPRRRVRQGDRLRQRGHRRVPARPRRPLRLHRDEPAHPGRAHRHRGDHRRRPGQLADADRQRRDPRGPRPLAGHPADPRRGPAVPHHHRGPGQRVPARHRPDHDLPLRGWRRRAARRRHDLRRGRDRRPLRLDAGQAHLPWPRLPDGGAPGQARARRVPDPWRLDQHPVPAGAARGARLPGRPARRRRSSTSVPACAPPACPPTAAPGCSPTSPTSRSTSRTAPAAPGSRRGPSCPAIDRAHSPTARRPRPAAASGPAGLRRGAARPGGRRASPRRPSATPTSRCSPPGSAPATSCTSHRTSPG